MTGTASHPTRLVRRTRRTLELNRVLVPRELRIRYSQSLLDVAWALVAPVVTMAVYGVVLTQGFGIEAECGPYLSSAWIGIVLWTFFATGVGGAVTSLVGSSDLISKLYFPREALPVSMVGAATADLAIGLAILFPLLLFQGVRPSAIWLALVVPLAVVVVWTLAISIIVAAVAAFVRDLVHAVSLLLRVGFFAVPVMYDSTFLPPVLQWSASANPLAVAITESRVILLCKGTPDWALLGIHGLAGLAALTGAVLYTASVEARITDVV